MADTSPPSAPAGDDPVALADRARLLELLERFTDADALALGREEFLAAWLEAGAQLYPHRLAGTRPTSRPAPEVWPPAPDLEPAPLAVPPCAGPGDVACTPATEAAPPRLFARRLELRTQLGAGRCGQTWRAHHHILGRDVAVKILPRALARTPVLADLCREAMALDKLTHRAFPRIYECDYTEDGAWYLVEELIDGEPLARTIQRGPMEPLAAIELVIELAEALRDAHARGIIHGDISANNLMLERSLPPRPRIIDLSECRFRDAFFAAADQRYAMTPRHQGDTGRVCGHPGFAAPELSRGGAKSERSDIYSLGAVLFMLLTGAQHPNPVIRDLLREDDDGERMRERLVTAVPEFGETFLAGELQDILALDPARRTATVDAVLDVLRAERDALKSVRNSERSTASARAALARGLQQQPAPGRPALARAPQDMSPRTSRRALVGAAFVVAAPLVAVVAWMLTFPSGAPPPIAAAAPKIELPAAPRPAAPDLPAPSPTAVAAAPAGLYPVTKVQVERALQVAADLLRACPNAPDWISLTVGVGESTELLEVNHAPADRDRPLDHCVQDIVEALRFPRSPPVRHMVRIDLRGTPLQ